MTGASAIARATPFRTVLVANRGEVALRILRTARSLGYRTVAVFSSADADAPHVHAADAACRLGGPAPADSYLNVPQLLRAAAEAGADAVHPGYGFLAENAAFARACTEAGLVFVGPSGDAIEAMGHKLGAKRRMRAVGVPCIPGEDGAERSDEALIAAAHAIGFPIMIKAAAGGGGRGMRRVERAQELADALRAARSEALGAFGNGDLLLERAIDGARHVEIQVAVDRRGRAIHLGERDCSVQRRHQKLIEEAPSPAVDEPLRERMGAAAIRAAQAVGYEGVGTVEFLLDAGRDFYFMEMNTRLQVEHAVTEAVTGVDLVELQLRIASGEPLALAQRDVRLSGHAIEVRLCAEDAERQFLPCSGRVGVWRAPAGARVEHALRDGIVVHPHYDSMVAKLVAHGGGRDEALRRLERALEDTVLLGVATNQRYLSACLRHPVFRGGHATTAFTVEQRAGLLEAAAVDVPRVLAIAACLDCGTSRRGPPHPFEIPMRLAVADDVVDVRTVLTGDGGVRVTIGEREFSVIARPIGRFAFDVDVDGVRERIVAWRDGATWHLHDRGGPATVHDRSLEATASTVAAASDGIVRAALNGRVVHVAATAGEPVSAGQALLAIEAMKMEHVHTAPIGGTIAAVEVRVGAQVAARQILVRIEPAGVRDVAS